VFSVPVSVYINLKTELTFPQKIYVITELQTFQSAHVFSRLLELKYGNVKTLLRITPRSIFSRSRKGSGTAIINGWRHLDIRFKITYIQHNV